MKRDSFILHNDSLDVLDDLNDQQTAELFRAIRDYNNGEEPELAGVMRAVFTPFRNQFERDNEKYRAVIERNRTNGKSGGRRKSIEKEEVTENPKEPTGFSGFPNKPTGSQKNPKEPDNDNDSDSDNENDNDNENERIDFSFFADIWNSSLPGHTKVSAITEKRKNQIRTRLPEFGKTKEEQQATFRAIVDKIKASPFLNGNNDRSWKPDFDWIFKNSDNWRKIYEGKFDTKDPKASVASTVNKTVTLTNGMIITLGVGEYIHERGHRTYNNGGPDIPFDAEPRPSDKHYYVREKNIWALNNWQI